MGAESQPLYFCLNPNTSYAAMLQVKTKDGGGGGGGGGRGEYGQNPFVAHLAALIVHIATINICGKPFHFNSLPIDVDIDGSGYGYGYRYGNGYVYGSEK